MKKTPVRFRKIRALCLKIDRKQQRPPRLAPVDDAAHHCMHCGADYVGYRCPQCGLTASFQRFTMKNALKGFMDIWGLGQRPIFSTMKDLLWRPGYMIRDYLSGHHLSYFPPFKLLAVLVAFITLTTWLLDIPLKYDNEMADVFKTIVFKDKTLEVLSPTLCGVIDDSFSFFNTHLLYRFILLNIIITFAAWRVFHKAKRYNLAETFISQIYINCQFFILALVSILVSGQYFLDSSLPVPYMMDDAIVFLVLLYDYRQLYGLSVKSTLWRLLLMLFLLYVIIFTLILSLLIPIVLYLWWTGAL